MSDEFHDAHRPDNKIKGMGWWPEEKRREYCLKIYGRGDRDEWLLLDLLGLGELTREEWIEQMRQHHPEIVSRWEAQRPPVGSLL